MSEEEVQVPMVYVDDIRPGAAFSFGFYAFLGAFCAYLIIAVIVAVILMMVGVLAWPGR